MGPIVVAFAQSECVPVAAQVMATGEMEVRTMPLFPAYDDCDVPPDTPPGMEMQRSQLPHWWEVPSIEVGSHKGLRNDVSPEHPLPSDNHSAGAGGLGEWMLDQLRPNDHGCCHGCLSAASCTGI